MNNAEKRKKDIIKVTFWFNIVSLIVSFFYISGKFTLAITMINSIFLGTFLLIEKYSQVFDGLLVANKFAKGLNKTLGEI